jgi:1-acyl-sn-glycerol-3-phosphate acyltransferase
VIYRVLRALCRLIFRWVGSWHVEGRENVPAKGALILAPNHLSYLDPPLVGCAIDRPAWFMGKAELFEVPVFKWLLPAVHAFPVRRGTGDRAALKRTLELLAEGEAVTLFPEGTRSQTGDLGEPEVGIGMIALRSGAAVVPMAIVGTDAMLPRTARFLRKAQVRIRIGPPLHFPLPRGKADREEYAAVARQVLEAIRALREGM